MTDSVTSQSVPSLPSLSRPPNGQQPRKLRDSCIHCANSKVKCNKEKPICSRCVRRRLPCEYKVSRRTGRTSRTNLLLGTATTTKSTGTSTASPTLHSTSVNINNGSSILDSALVAGGSSQATLLTPSATLPTALSSPEHCISETPDLWRVFLSPSALDSGVGDLSSLIPTGTDVGDIFASVMTSPQFDTRDIHSLSTQGAGDSLLVTEQPLFPTPALPSRSVGFSPTDTKHSACCLAIVLNILTNLFPGAATTCKQPGSQPGPSKARTIEAVISDNKQIIETINTVLDCPCSQDEYVISIVSLAVFKIMGWYVAAARNRTSPHEDITAWRSDPNVHSGLGSPSSFDEQVLRLPAVVGSYCIDGDDQNRMAAQLVLSELHRVQRLVNVLSLRLEGIRLRTCLYSASTSGSSSATDSEDISLLSAMGSSSLSGPTFSQIEEDLRRRLRAISSETIDILRRV